MQHATATATSYHAEKRAEHRAKMEDLESRPKLAIMKEAAVAVRNQVIDMDGVPQPQQNKSRRT